jgi:hypothetical protein
LGSFPDVSESLPDVLESFPVVLGSFPDVRETLPDVLGRVPYTDAFITHKYLSSLKKHNFIYYRNYNRFGALYANPRGKPPRLLQINPRKRGFNPEPNFKIRLDF